MKRVLLTGAAVTALMLAGAPMALAQEAAPSDCAAATTALNAADVAHREAVAADKAVVDAEDADQVLKDAKKRLENAEKKRDDAKAEVTSRRTNLDREIAESKKDDPTTTDVNESVVTPVEQERVDAAQRLLNQAEKELRDREETVRDRRDERDDAKDAADGKTRKLREEAAKTDAAALKIALDDARADFDQKCLGGSTTTPAPAPVNYDCEDFPLADGRSAKDVLNETPGVDEHGIDNNGNGIPCEPSDPSGTDSSVSVVPNDAPETGDGSTEPQSSLQHLAVGAAMLNFFGLAFAAHRRGGVLRP